MQLECLLCYIILSYRNSYIKVYSRSLLNVHNYIPALTKILKQQKRFFVSLFVALIFYLVLCHVETLRREEVFDDLAPASRLYMIIKYWFDE